MIAKALDLRSSSKRICTVRQTRLRTLAMLHKLVTSLAWAFLVFVVFATLSPAAFRPVLTANETAPIVIIERVGAFGLLGFLFTISYPKRRAFVCTIVFGSAVWLELLQLVALARHARVIDAVEKLIGGGLGVIAAVCLISFIAAREVSDMPLAVNHSC